MVPFRRSRPVVEGVGRDGTPSGQASTADSGQARRKRSHHVYKTTLIGRLGQHADAKTAQNNREYVVLNLATQESWKNDKGEYETRTEWHCVYAWSNLLKLARILQKGQLITLEGTLRYPEVTEDVEGASFKYRIAAIHAISMKRLSRLEAADHAADGGGDE